MLKKQITVALLLVFCFGLAEAGPTKETVNEYGVPCLKITRDGGATALYNGGFRYDYTIENICDRSFDIGINTMAGWKSYTVIGGNASRNWFCTDGHKGNKDCGGGIMNFDYK